MSDQRPTTVQVEAAKLRVVTDRRLGKVTPQWVLDIAATVVTRS